MAMLELEQYAQDIEKIRQSILNAGEALHIEHMQEQVDELKEEMIDEE
jgi:peptide chain release factor 2